MISPDSNETTTSSTTRSEKTEQVGTEPSEGWIGPNEQGQQQYLKDGRIYLVGNDGRLFYCHPCTVRYQQRQRQIEIQRQANAQRAMAVAQQQNVLKPQPNAVVPGPTGPPSVAAKPLSWDFGATKVNVQEAVAAAIARNKK